MQHRPSSPRLCRLDAGKLAVLVILVILLIALLTASYLPQTPILP